MPQSAISEHITITPKTLAKQGISGQNKEKQNYDKNTICLPRQYLNNTRIERMCLLLDKTDYQIPGTLEFGNLFWSFATFKNTAGRSEVLPGATKKENRESTLNDFTQLLLALHKML